MKRSERGCPRTLRAWRKQALDALDRVRKIEGRLLEVHGQLDIVQQTVGKQHREAQEVRSRLNDLTRSTLRAALSCADSNSSLRFHLITLAAQAQELVIAGSGAALVIQAPVIRKPEHRATDDTGQVRSW